MGFSRQKYWSGLPVPPPGPLRFPKGKSEQLLIRDGEIRKDQPRNNNVVLGQCPGSASRDTHNNL